MIVFTAKKESKMNDDEWRMEQSVSVSVSGRNGFVHATLSRFLSNLSLVHTHKHTHTTNECSPKASLGFSVILNDC